MSTPRATGGGAFDRGERPIYFLAGGGEYNAGPHVLTAVNELMGQAEEQRLNALLEAGNRVLLDSGIFWLTNRHSRTHGVTMDEALALAPEQIDGFAQLRERYVHLATTYGDQLWGYIELDQGGREHKLRQREALQDLGLAPIPVYHPLVDGWDYFDELASQYDRICVGNIVQAPGPVRLRILHTLWERRQNYPHLWIHALGLTASEVCLAAPPDSCDSSSWLAPLRWNHQRIETAMLRRIGSLPDGFRYADGDQGSYAAAARLCADAAGALGRCWQHSATRLHDLLGQLALGPEGAQHR
ncbi:hypothetical protein LN042_18860 [Kitasatospora sp. RB6PN24]|uniref:hypothetical protein n=1 Tax=Kitasatospora humi TaxID=2893891 RepID=UPI001E2AE678|nr:hypothetical protein [Kitasatospora humi]MCC9309117.1 hypothetical protein [Kitasatospora humi]